MSCDKGEISLCQLGLGGKDISPAYLIPCTSEGADDTAHLEGEEDDANGAEGEAGGLDDGVDGQFVVPFEGVENELFVVGEIEEEFLLNGSLMLQRVGPVHGLEEVLGAGDEVGFAVTNQSVASYGKLIVHPTGEGTQLAAVGLGKSGCDERTATGCALHYDAGIAHAGYDAVATEEIGPLGGCAAEVFG